MPTSTPELARTTVSAGNWLPGYEIHEAIGSGGCGTVYRARQLAVGRGVALKVIELDRDLHPSLAARFQREVSSLGQFSHPNIVQVYDSGWHDRRAFIVMELLDGEDLGQRLRRTGRLDERVAWCGDPPDGGGAGSRRGPRRRPPGREAGEPLPGRRRRRMWDCRRTCRW